MLMGIDPPSRESPLPEIEFYPKPSFAQVLRSLQASVVSSQRKFALKAKAVRLLGTSESQHSNSNGFRWHWLMLVGHAGLLTCLYWPFLVFL